MGKYPSTNFKLNTRIEMSLFERRVFKKGPFEMCYRYKVFKGPYKDLNQFLEVSSLLGICWKIQKTLASGC